MNSDLEGRLRNTQLPNKKGLMPVYEAVINSIESIEERHELTQKPLDQFSIGLYVIRDTFDAPEHPLVSLMPIKQFKVVDDGIGFTDDNWDSFNTLDSGQKLDKGCRGVGRLMWLKAFKSVIVDSTYEKSGQMQRRRFKFDAKEEVSSLQPNDASNETHCTTVTLDGFKEQFAEATQKSLDKIALGLLEHCLWYFIRAEGVPKITVSEGQETIELFDLFDTYMHTSASNEHC